MFSNEVAKKVLSSVGADWYDYEVLICTDDGFTDKIGAVLQFANLEITLEMSIGGGEFMAKAYWEANPKKIQDWNKHNLFYNHRNGPFQIYEINTRIILQLRPFVLLSTPTTRLPKKMVEEALFIVNHVEALKLSVTKCTHAPTPSSGAARLL